MRLKNISENDFKFEGIEIPAGGISEDLDLYVAQRLLALYFRNPLVPVEEEQKTEVSEEEEVEEEIEEESSTEGEEEQLPPVSEYVCPICGKRFKNQGSVNLHKGRKHKEE